MHIDVHELDVFVLWGSAITFLAILAVRVSSRTRLPSLLLYLLMGVAIGEAGFGIHFRVRSASPVASVHRASFRSPQASSHTDMRSRVSSPVNFDAGSNAISILAKHCLAKAGVTLPSSV